VVEVVDVIVEVVEDDEVELDDLHLELVAITLGTPGMAPF
jgi:hypothetical protein